MALYPFVNNDTVLSVLNDCNHEKRKCACDAVTIGIKNEKKVTNNAF